MNLEILSSSCREGCEIPMKQARWALSANWIEIDELAEKGNIIERGGIGLWTVLAPLPALASPTSPWSTAPWPNSAFWRTFQASLQFKASFVIEFAAESNKSLFMNLFRDFQLHPSKAGTNNLLGTRNPSKTPKRLEICSQTRLLTTESAANRIKWLFIINFIHMRWCCRVWNRRWAPFLDKVMQFALLPRFDVGKVLWCI